VSVNGDQYNAVENQDLPLLSEGEAALRAVLAKISSVPLYHYTFLVLIIVVAASLRFYQLGEWSFWGDEAFTVGGREDGFNYNLLRQSLSLSLIQWVVAEFGITEWNARLVPLLFGVISVPIVYLFSKRIFNPAIGLLSGLFLALSPWHLYWSQNARFYTALLLFYSLALFFFYLGLEEDRPWYFVLALVFLGLAAKERLIALFFIPVILLYLALLFLLPFPRPRGLRLRNLAIFFAPGFGGGLFFVAPYARNVGGWLEGFGFANNHPIWLLAGAVFYIGLPLICMGIVGGWHLLRRKHHAGLLLSSSAVVPLLILMAIAPFHYTANRYAFVILTSWIVLAGVAVVYLLQNTPRKIQALPVGILLLLLLHPLGENALYYQFQQGNRANWKGAFAYVQQHKLPSDRVVSPNTELGDFYIEGGATVGFANLDLGDIERAEHRVWIVEDMLGRDLYPEIHAWLAQNAQLVSVFDNRVQARNFYMRVYLYDPAKA
jgi:hypothetical protein